MLCQERRGKREQGERRNRVSPGTGESTEEEEKQREVCVGGSPSGGWDPSPPFSTFVPGSRAVNEGGKSESTPFPGNEREASADHRRRRYH